MAIPDGVETVTINSCTPLTLPDGTLIRGHIRFVAPDLNLIADEDFIFGGESPAELCEGSFSITLVPPDATGISPTGWTYTAIAEFTNAPGWTRYVDITKDNPVVCFDDVIVLTPGDVTNPDTTFVRKAGDTMTGALILSGAPTVDLQAATKKYVDDLAVDTSAFVEVAGDTMTGPLVLSGNPTLALGAAPKQYVDQAEADAVTAATAAAAAESVSLSGDTMTGPLILSGAPATGLQAATKTYVDAGDAATLAAAAAESVSISGDTMTGPLVLNADPSLALGAATKQYADAGDATAVKLTGDQTVAGIKTFTSSPVAPTPTTDGQVAIKSYVDDGDDAVTAYVDGLDAANVKLTGDQTIAGIKTFTSTPVGPAANPTTANQLSRKQYVDDREAFLQGEIDTLDAQNVKLTGDQTIAGIKTFTSIPVGPASDPVSADQLTRKFYVDALDAANVKLTGDQTVNGIKDFQASPLVPTPTTATQAAPKGYVDSGDATNASDIADVASDLATLDASVVKLTGDQTVNGIKTFGSIPVLPGSDPVAANEATRKAYVDALDAANVKLTGAQTINGVKTFGSIPVLPGTDPVAANEAVRKAYVDTLDAQNVKLTGSQTITGAKTFTSTVQIDSASDAVATGSLIGAEAFDSYRRSHRGREEWGPGSGARDTFLERIAAAVLQVTSQIRVTGAAPSNAADLTRKDYVDTLDGANVKLTGAQTIAGVKTFSSEPVVPTPTIASSPTRKDYVDGLDAQNVKLTGAQTVAGVKTFSSEPVVPTPTQTGSPTTKSYVDTLDAQNVKLTGAQTVAGIKTFSSIPVLPASSPTTANQATRKQYVDDTIASEIFARMGLDTGVLTGGEVNVNADPTKVDISATVGVILDYVTTPASPILTKIVYAGGTVTISNLSAPITWLMLSNTSTIVQQTTRPTNTQRRTHIQLGAVLVAGGVIIEDQTLPSILPHPLNQMYDLIDALGNFNVTGNDMSAASTNLTVAKTAGTVFARGFNHFAGATLTNDPHISSMASQNPMSMRYVTQTPAAPVAPVTSVDPTMYDVAGVITAVPGGANTSTIQRVWAVPLNTTANQIIIQYGQTAYSTLDAAIAAVGSSSYVHNPDLADAILIGFIVTKKSCTDLSNTTDARIIKAAKISGNAAGDSESLSLAVLLSGSTMTGPLILNADPSNVLGAATKQYVDTLDAQDVKLTGAQTVAGVKTFSSIPVGPASDPTTGNQLTRKTYVDNLDAANVKLTGDQSVAGIKTFSSIPVGPASDPTTANQLTRKSYVDTLDGANVKLTGDQSVAGIKTFSSIPVLPASDPTTANQATRKSYVDTLDGANVKLTGNQSISGVKTFSTGVVLSAGVNSIRSAVKGSSTARNTTATTAADPDLAVSVEANARYNVTCIAGWTAGAGGMRVDFSGPASATMLFVDNDGSTAATIGTDLTFSVTKGTTFNGTLITAGTAGTLTMRWAQNVSDASDTTLLAGSGLHVIRVA